MSKDKGTYPELKLGWYPTIGGAPYTGAWSQAVALDSKNPEAAYWLARYLGSYEAQLGLVLVGWSVDRTDVLTDPLWDNPAVPEYAYPIKMVNQYCLELWDATKDTVGDHFYFNSVAGMLIYEMQMDVLAKAVSRELTIDQMIAELVAKTIDLQTKFGAGVPIREEL
jgi:multiple sugar transport system substrate-binding protein